MTRTFTLRQQSNNKGYYVQITLSCKPTNAVNRNVILTYAADPIWKNACSAGVDIFFDYYSRQSSDGLEITIQEIKWMPVDTNHLIVLYTTIQALCEAMDCKIEGLEFTIAHEHFVFPERRKQSNA